MRLTEFERAFSRLSEQEQTALAAIYRLGMDTAAYDVGCSVGTLAYLLPTAREHLAQVLDRLDLP